MAVSNSWDEYNKKQRAIMEERERANAGKKQAPVKVGNRTPKTGATKKPAQKKQDTKK